VPRAGRLLLYDQLVAAHIHSVAHDVSLGLSSHTPRQSPCKGLFQHAPSKRDNDVRAAAISSRYFDCPFAAPFRIIENLLFLLKDNSKLFKQYRQSSTMSITSTRAVSQPTIQRATLPGLWANQLHSHRGKPVIGEI
jgi:hypothetical protein